MPIGIGLAIAGIAGAGASIFGASSQVSAEQAAIAAQQQMYQQGLNVQKGYVNQAQGTLQPYINAGQAPLAWYNYLTGTGPAPGAQGASGTLGDPNAQGGSAGWSGDMGQGGPGGPFGGIWPSGWQGDPFNRDRGQGQGGMTTGGAPTPAMPVYNPLNAPLTAPFTAANLPYTPGYQFQLGQGNQAAINSAAAMGYGGPSGPTLKAVVDYSQGLAGTSYNQQFANYLTQNQQIANMLLAPAGLGANAAGELGSIYGSAGNAALAGATATGQGIASSTAGIGNALAGGAAGVANSLGGSVLQYALYNKLLGGASNPGAPIGAGSYVSNDLMAGGGGFNYGGGPFQSAYATG